MSEPRPHSYLLDDDSLVRELWSYVFHSKGAPFTSFSNVDDFLVALPNIAKTSNLYIDQDLNHALTGSELARDLISKGFENVYLASGHEEEDLPKVIGLKGHVGKTPPI